MKNFYDPRHRHRQFLVQELFKIDFYPEQEIHEEVQKILNEEPMLDEQIQKAAPDFSLDKINKIDLAVLRLAAYELLIVKTEPPKVVIDEAIELAKEFGGETSPSFINGALGKIISQVEQ